MKLKNIIRESRETYKGDMSGVPVVGLEHLIPEEICFSEYEVSSDKSFTKAFHKGQVLFGRRRAYQKKAAIAHVDGVCSGDIMVLEAIPGKVEPSLVPFIIQNDRFFDYAIQHSEGGLSPRVKWNAIANYEFDLPSLDEQKVLADKLWAAYKLKESYRQLLTTTDEMVKAKFQKMFGEATMEQLGNIATYINGSAYKPEEWSSEGLPIVRIQNLTDENAAYNHFNGDLSKKVAITNGDILISWSATLGVFVWKKGNALLNQHIFKVRFDKKPIKVAYFIYAVRAKMEEMAQMTHGSTMKHIVKSDFDATLIPYPSIKEQERFVAIATQAEATKASLRQSIESIDRVIRSIINQ